MILILQCSPPDKLFYSELEEQGSKLEKIGYKRGSGILTPFPFLLYSDVFILLDIESEEFKPINFEIKE